MSEKSWKLNHITKDELDDEIYDFIDALLGNIYTQNERSKDVRLITREISINVQRHGMKNGTRELKLELKKITPTKISVRITHDGDKFDPFAADSKCDFIKSIKERLRIKIKLHLGDSAPRYNIDVEVDI